MSEKPELLPCPFCGGEALAEHVGDKWVVVCGNEEIDACPAFITWGVYAREADAVEVWNTRA